MLRMQRQNEIHSGHGKVRTEVIKSSPGQMWEAPPGRRGKGKRDKNDERDKDKCGGQYTVGHHVHSRGS